METLLDEYIAIVGILLPLVIAYLKNQMWSKRIKMLLTIGVTILASLGHMVYSGSFEAMSLGKTFLTLLTISTTTYKWVWQPTRVAKVIEDKTGIGKQA
jgi:hypothetical protein